jgi:hypothetical protein
MKEHGVMPRELNVNDSSELELELEAAIRAVRVQPTFLADDRGRVAVLVPVFHVSAWKLREALYELNNIVLPVMSPAVERAYVNLVTAAEGLLADLDNSYDSPVLCGRSRGAVFHYDSGVPGEGGYFG